MFQYIYENVLKDDRLKKKEMIGFQVTAVIVKIKLTLRYMSFIVHIIKQHFHASRV